MVILQQQHSQTGDYLKNIGTATLKAAALEHGAGRVDPLADLKALPQWVAWRWMKVRPNNRLQKVPMNPHTNPHTRGSWAKPNNPSSWGTYQQALACKEEHEHHGIGFMFTEDDPYVGWDFDKCRDPETGVIHPAVVRILAQLDTFTEISPSGTGVKAISKGTKPGPRCRTDNTPWGGHIEIYEKKRLFTITEATIGGRGSFVRDSQDVLDSIYREFFPEPQEPVQAPVRTDTNRVRTLSERELLDKARNAEDLGPKFRALFDQGDISGCGNNPSTADYHLCSQLAFWTGGDAVWVEALFSQSALGRRDKWIDRPDYRKTTIDRAIENTSRRYEPEKHKPRKGSTNTRDTVARLEQYAVLGYGWEEITGNSSSGASDYTAFVVMLWAAWKANSLEIDMNVRDLAVAGGFGSRQTATKALTRLQNTHRWVVKVADAKGAKAARYRIKDIAPSIRDQALIATHPKVDQALIREQFSSNYTPCEYQVLGLVLGKSVEIRNTSPTSYEDYDKNGRPLSHGGEAPVGSVGMVAARVLDIIHYHSRLTGEPATLDFIHERTRIRRDHLKDRPVRKLLAAGLILEVEGGYTTPPDVEERVERELEISGCNKKKRRQEEKDAKEREIRHIHLMRKAGADFDVIAAETGRSVAEIMDILKPPDEAPTYDDLDRLKEGREIRDADGYIGDLQKADGFGYFPDPKSREPRLSSTAEVSKGKLPQARKAPPEPATASAITSVADAHKDNCLCEECLTAVDMNPYVSLVT